MNPKVDFYFLKAKTFGEELELLRLLLLDCMLVEELKWGVPCYTFENTNIVLIHEFKNYCAMLFPKGALLSDADKILAQQTENTQSSRQIRFTSIQEIVDLELVLKNYVYEAVEIEKAGLKVALKKTEDYVVPDEFLQKMEEMPALKIAFYALTPGRQRGYLLHFAAAKQAKTRESRIEKWIPQILNGVGLNDEYTSTKTRKS